MLALIAFAMVFGSLVALGIYLVLCDLEASWVNRVVVEFSRRWPGRCLICSFHRWGYWHGFEEDYTPRPHGCDDRRGNHVDSRNRPGHDPSRILHP